MELIAGVEPERDNYTLSPHNKKSNIVGNKRTVVNGDNIKQMKKKRRISLQSINTNGNVNNNFSSGAGIQQTDSNTAYYDNNSVWYYEDFHNVVITDEAIDEAIKLSVKYQTDKKLPDKAIDLIDLACSRFNLKEESEVKIVSDKNIQFELK